MRYIEHISLKNYKSLADVELPMRRLNVLIGQNGSGKSNFLSFFHLLQQGADSKLSQTIDQMGGLEQITYYGNTYLFAPSSFVQWEVKFSPAETNIPLFYSGALGIRGVGISDFVIHKEYLSEPSASSERPDIIYLDMAKEGMIRTVRSQTNENEFAGRGDVYLVGQDLALAQLRSKINFPVLYELRETISDWSMFHGFGDSTLQNIRAPQLLSGAVKLRLAPDGSNLVSVLQQLANVSDYEAAYERLNLAMSAVFDDFKRIDIVTVAAGRGELNYRTNHFGTKQIPAFSMSDGQLRFLFLATLLLLPKPPPLITIDEPEIGMHPRMLSVFAELLQEASERTQIIVSTHSPELVDRIAPEDVIVVEQQDGMTNLRHLPIERLSVWMERYSLGKLWTMGKLNRP